MADGYDVSIEDNKLVISSDLIAGGSVTIDITNAVGFTTENKSIDIAKVIANLEGLPEEVKEQARQEYIEYLDKNNPDLVPFARLELARYKQDPKWPDDVNPIYHIDLSDALSSDQIRESLQKTLLTLGSIEDPVERREIFDALYATIESKDYLGGQKDSILDTAYTFGEYLAITGDTEMVQRWYDHGVQSENNPEGVPPYAIDMMIHAGIEAELAAGHEITPEHMHDLVEYYYRGADDATIAQAYNAIAFSISDDATAAQYEEIFSGKTENPLDAYRALEAQVTDSPAFKGAVEASVNSGVSVDDGANVGKSDSPQYYDNGDVVISLEGNEFNITQALIEEASGESGKKDGLGGLESFLKKEFYQFVADREGFLGLGSNGLADKMENATKVVQGIDKVFAENRQEIIGDIIQERLVNGQSVPPELSEEELNALVVEEMQPLIHAYENVFAAMDAEINGGVAQDIPAKDLLIIAATAGDSFTPEQWAALGELTKDSDLPPEAAAFIDMMAEGKISDEAMADFRDAALEYANDPSPENYNHLVEIAGSGEINTVMNANADLKDEAALLKLAADINADANISDDVKKEIQDMVSAYMNDGQMPQMTQQEMLELVTALKDNPEAIDAIRKNFGEAINSAIDGNEDLTEDQKALLKGILAADSGVSSEQIAEIVGKLDDGSGTGEITFDNLTIGEMLDIAEAYTGYQDGSVSQSYVEIGKAEDGSPLYGRPIEQSDIGEEQLKAAFEAQTGQPLPEGAKIQIKDGVVQLIIDVPHGSDVSDYQAFIDAQGAEFQPPQDAVEGTTTTVNTPDENSSDNPQYGDNSDSSSTETTITTGAQSAEDGKIVITLDPSQPITLDGEGGHVESANSKLYFVPDNQDEANSDQAQKIRLISNVIAASMTEGMTPEQAEASQAAINEAVQRLLPVMMSDEFSGDQALLDKKIGDLSAGEMLQIASKAIEIDPSVAGPLADVITSKFMPEAGEATKAVIQDFLVNMHNLDPAAQEEIAKALDGQDISPQQALNILDNYYLREPARALEELPKPESFSEGDSDRIIQIATGHGLGNPDKDGDGKVTKDEYAAWYDYDSFKTITEEEVTRRAELMKNLVVENAPSQFAFINNMADGPLKSILLELAPIFLMFGEMLGLVPKGTVAEMNAAKEYLNVESEVAAVMADPSVQQGMDYTPPVDPVTGKVKLDIMGQLQEHMEQQELKKEEFLAAITPAVEGVGNDLSDMDRFALNVLCADEELMDKIIANPPTEEQLASKEEFEKYLDGLGISDDDKNQLMQIAFEPPTIEDMIAKMKEESSAVIHHDSVGNSVDVETGPIGSEKYTSSESYHFSYDTTDTNPERAEANSLIALGYVTHGVQDLAEKYGVDKDDLVSYVFTGKPSLEDMGITKDADVRALLADIKAVGAETGIEISRDPETGSYVVEYNGVTINLKDVAGAENPDLFMAGMADRLNELGIKIEMPEEGRDQGMFDEYYSEMSGNNIQVDLAGLLPEGANQDSLNQAIQNIFIPSYMYANSAGEPDLGDNMTIEALSYLNPTPPAATVQQPVQQPVVGGPQ